MKKRYLFFLFVFAISTVQTQTAYHNAWGSGDKLWSTASNWSNGVPDAVEVVNIWNNPDSLYVDGSETIKQLILAPAVARDFVFKGVGANAITIDVQGDLGTVADGSKGILHDSDDPYNMIFDCDINIANSTTPSQTWLGITLLKIEGNSGSAITFDTNSTLNLGGTGSTAVYGSNFGQFNFKGEITGSKDLYFAVNTTSVFESTADATNFTGGFWLFTGADVTVNTVAPQVFNNTNIRGNGTSGTLTVNNENVLKSKLEIINNSNRAMTLNINANQEEMKVIEMKNNGTHSITINLGASVDKLHFEDCSSEVWNTSGSNTLVINNFSPAVLRFGTDQNGLTASQVDQITHDGGGGDLALNEGGYLVYENTLTTNATVAAAFTIYPNPVTDQLQIRSKENVASVQLTNAMGKVLYWKSGMQQNVNVSQLATGVYFVTVRTADGKVATKKFIKS